jgi:DNA anti-recombination protein RmuC
MPEDPLDARFDRLRQDLRQDIQASADQLRQDLRQEFRQDIQASAAELRQDIRHDIQASAAELRQEFRQDIQASAVETRRHFEVIAESLRSEIQVVAEGLSMLDEKVERFRDEVHQEFGKVDRRFLHLDARIAVLERR